MDLIIYTDGSATGGTTKGGSAAVVTRGDLEQPQVYSRILDRGSPYTSSFEEELQAMMNAASWCVEHLAPNQRCLIATDSQSLCKALIGYSIEVHELKLCLEETLGTIIIQWIPGHADVPGNELADSAAKAATTLESEPKAVSLRGIAPEIRKAIPDEPIDHLRTSKVYEKYSRARESTLNRKDQVMLARIRSGHSLLFRQYRHRIGHAVDPHCIRCTENKLDDLEHWLVCDGTLEARMKHFGYTRLELSDLTRWPRESVALARSTLFRGVGDC